MEIIKKKQENKGPLTDCSVLAAALVSVRRKIFIHKVDTIIDYTERFKFTYGKYHTSITSSICV